MKREIKFRGKRTENGEWVYGGVWFGFNDAVFIVQIEGDKLQHYQVEPETVGQYAGFKEKNHKEVFEGDLVRAWSAGSCATFQIKWRQEGSPSWILYPAFQSKQMWYLSVTEYRKDKIFITVSGERAGQNQEGFYDDGVEIIGNVHDNRELLEK